MTCGRALTSAAPVPRLIVPTGRWTDPALPGFLGIQLLARYLPQTCGYPAAEMRSG